MKARLGKPVFVVAIALAIPLAIACGGRVEADPAASTSGSATTTTTATAMDTPTTTSAPPPSEASRCGWTTSVGSTLPTGGVAGVTVTLPAAPEPTATIGYRACPALPDGCADGNAQAWAQRIVAECAAATGVCSAGASTTYFGIAASGCVEHVVFDQKTRNDLDAYVACVLWGASCSRCGASEQVVTAATCASP